jgi:hypothetical protein
VETVNERALYQTVFDLVEHLSKMQLSDSSKHLIVSYVQGASGENASENARAAIRRYLDLRQELPSLADIRARSRNGPLTALDHLLLKMEYEAAGRR